MYKHKTTLEILYVSLIYSHNASYFIKLKILNGILHSFVVVCYTLRSNLYNPKKDSIFTK